MSESSRRRELSERFGGLHLAWAKLLVRGFASAGVRAIFVSPGSRSTPLALAAYEERGLETRVIVDERAAGFAALGHARVTGSPAVVICTSGTAPAHYYPALLEAEQSHVPLVVVSADRPLELAGVGAPQTIDQAKLFGDHVRAFFELGAPDVDALELPLRVAAHAVLGATSPVAGPVHVNARFRKPLEPVDVDESRFAERARALLEAGAPRGLPANVAPSALSVAHLASRVRSASGVVVVAGPARGPAGGTVAARDAARTAAVAHFAERSGAAVIAEVTSGVARAPGGAVTSLDALVQAGVLDGDPGLICLEIGSPVVASRYQAWAARSPGSRRIVVSEVGWPDPFGGLAEVVHGEPADVLGAVADALARDGGSSALRASREARRALVRRASERIVAGAETLCEAAPLGEPGVAALVASALPRGATLVVGNSLAVRDLDAFAAHRLDGVTVLHQRGVSGIDGLLAGAVGARWATDRSSPVALLYGDVSALHDVGSFALLRDVEGPLAVLVVDNGGGRIFEELPIARVPHLEDAMRALFLTPPPAFVEGVAQAFGIDFERARDASSLRAALARALASSRPRVVEVCVDPGVGSEARRALLGLAAAEAAP